MSAHCSEQERDSLSRRGAIKRHEQRHPKLPKPARRITTGFATLIPMEELLHPDRPLRQQLLDGWAIRSDARAPTRVSPVVVRDLASPK